MHEAIEVLQVAQRIAWTVIRLLIQLFGLCWTLPARIWRRGAAGSSKVAAAETWDLELPPPPATPDVAALAESLRHAQLSESPWPQVPEQPRPPTTMTYGAYLRRQP